MQIELRLFPETPIRLDFSYYPKLAAAIYKTISHTDSEFADDLHSGESYRNRIKLFGFSPLHSKQTEIHPENPSENKSGGLVFKGPCTLTVCSPWPELMSRLEEGILKGPQLLIGSQLIYVRGITVVPMPDFKEKMVWSFQKPASCVTSWSKKDENQKIYVLPGLPVDEKDCELLLRQNLIHKWRRLTGIRPDIATAWLRNGEAREHDAKEPTEDDVRIRILPISDRKKFHKKRHFIKKAPVISWIGPVEITAPRTIQRIAWSCGLGEMNSMGFGVVREAVR